MRSNLFLILSLCFAVFQLGHGRLCWLRQFAESSAQKIGEERLRVHIDGGRRIGIGQINAGQQSVSHRFVPRARDS